MDSKLAILTERERAALRLLAAGHGAKSIAAELHISVHAVNERLRKARQKLGVTSSREAARRLQIGEGATHSLVDDKIVLGGGSVIAADCHRRVVGSSRLALYLLGAVIMVFLLASAIVFWAQRPPAGPNPHVVSTFPAQGSVIPAGPFTLTIKFDRPMRDHAYSIVNGSAASTPDCDYRARLMPDQRTFVVQCKAAPGHHYWLWFNRQPYMNFQSIDGFPSIPYHLEFSVR